MTGTQGKTKEAAQEVTHGVPELSTMVVTGMRSNTIPNGMPVITTMVRPLRPGRVLLEVTVSDGLCLVAGGYARAERESPQQQEPEGLTSGTRGRWTPTSGHFLLFFYLSRGRR